MSSLSFELTSYRCVLNCWVWSSWWGEVKVELASNQWMEESEGLYGQLGSVGVRLQRDVGPSFCGIVKSIRLLNPIERIAVTPKETAEYLP